MSDQSLFKPVKQLLEQAFIDGWAELVPVVWDNTDRDDVEAWVRFTAPSLVPIGKSIGSPDSVEEHYSGVAFVQAFVRKGTGKFNAMELLDKAAEIYRNRSFEGNGVVVQVDDFSVVPNAGSRGAYSMSNLQIRLRAEKVFVNERT